MTSTGRRASSLATAASRSGFQVRRTIFNSDGLAFDVAKVAQPLPEVVPYGSIVDDADPRNLGRALLRTRRERPRRRRAAEQRDEMAPIHVWMAPVPGDSSKHQFGTSMPQGGHPPPHSLTSLARRRNGSGIVSPSAFAVLRFTARPHLTGRSYASMARCGAWHI